MEKFEEFSISPQLISTFIENTPIAYIILDEDRRIHYINKSFMELRNLVRETTIGEYCYNISNGGTPCPNCAVEDAIRTCSPSFVVRRDLLPNGKVKYIDDYAIPLNDINDGVHRYTLEIMINRSDEMSLKEKRSKDFQELVSLFADLLESKDTYTANHTDNTATIAYHLAKELGLSDEEVNNVSLAARLHDIGKVGIPNTIINKPGKLTDEEFEIIKTHPVRSYDMIKDLASFKEIAEMVRHHHERVDGKGYPDGLKGEELSIGSRIVAVADTFEAMTSDRSYRKALPVEVALAEMRRVAGTQLDAHIVEVFEKMEFDYDTFEPAKTKKNRKNDEEDRVERTINSTAVHSEKSDWKRMKVSGLDINRVMKAIFDNTPCGYVMMKPDHTVVYASEYFLNYLGLDKDSVIGKKCYQVNDDDSTPCNACAVRESIKAGETYKLTREQITPEGVKTFDMYGIPLKDESGKVEYVIEITIDRTKEANIEKSRLNDYKTLFEILSNLVKIKGADIDSKEMLDKIPELKSRLKELFEIK